MTREGFHVASTLADVSHRTDAFCKGVRSLSCRDHRTVRECLELHVGVLMSTCAISEWFMGVRTLFAYAGNSLTNLARPLHR